MLVYLGGGSIISTCSASKHKLGIIQIVERDKMSDCISEGHLCGEDVDFDADSRKKFEVGMSSKILMV